MAPSVEAFSRLPSGEGLIDGRAVRSALEGWLWGAAGFSLLVGLAYWSPADVRLALARLATPWRAVEWPGGEVHPRVPRCRVPPHRRVPAAWRAIAKGETLTVYVTERRPPAAGAADLRDRSLPTAPETENACSPSRTCGTSAGQLPGGRSREPAPAVRPAPDPGDGRGTTTGSLRWSSTIATPPRSKSFQITITRPYSGRRPETTTSGVGHDTGDWSIRRGRPDRRRERPPRKGVAPSPGQQPAA